jgi:type II secretory pathway pseudopilin PulG
LALKNTSNNQRARDAKRASASGFTMVEMCIAMVILFVGLMAVATSISYALMASNRGRMITNNKLLIMSVIEQMETLRNTRQLTFGQIANVNEVDNTGANTTFAGFPKTPQQVSMNPGPDGIFATADDFTSAGADGVYGTADDRANDMTLLRPGYTREIVISTLSSNIKKITVTVTYPGPANSRVTLQATSYLNNDSQSNYIN